jgi:hypothetical protein
MNYIHACHDNVAATIARRHRDINFSFVRAVHEINVAARTKSIEEVCKEDAPDGTHLRKGHAFQPTFSPLCFKFGQVILPHTMSSPQFLFQAHNYRLKAHLYLEKGPFCPKRACESMWIRAIPHRSGSIDSARAVDGSTYYEYVAGTVHAGAYYRRVQRLM